MIVDQKNNIYYATEDHQAYIYYGNNGSIVKIEGLNDELTDNHITALALDSNDTLYLGTFAGIYYLLSGSTRVEKFIYKDENSDDKVARKVFALVIDHNDNLYVTSDKAKFFSIQELKMYSLVDEHKLNELIYAFAVDQENNIYFGICVFKY